ncbi:MAG TPA: AsmA family protein [Hyphomonadaceae bacterium]|nr:AsmA family protein [Hyphomonadaceae bacterium]
MATFKEHLQRLKERAKGIKTPKFSRIPKVALITVGAVFGILLIGWVAINLLLANPNTGTPMINWALKTFGGGRAQVSTGQLTHPFSNRFALRTLDWPGSFNAREMDIDYDLFGFLPNHPWAKRIRIRDGVLTLPEKTTNRTTLNPQALVDEIDAQNMLIRFTRRGKPHEATLVSAEGSFAKGTVEAQAVAGQNHLTFDGLAKDWGGALKGKVTASGQNLKDLAEVVGASAPDTPPFNVRGDLTLWKREWTVANLTGRMGDSDISGAVGIDLKPKKPFLTVDIKSNKLDFDDMGVMFGIPIGAGRGETKNAEQVKAKQVFDRSARLIPDTRLDFSRLAAVDADISFNAPKVVDAPAGINAMTLKATLRDQVLDFSRALVKTMTGDLDARVRINAQKDPAQTKASGTLQNVAITRLVNTTLVRGTLNGSFGLNMTGSGFREAAASATGRVGVWSNNSELAHIATEAAGLDLGEILLDLSRSDKGKEFLKSRCLAANIDVKNGQATINPAVIDNKDSLILASGGANLKSEAIDLRVKAKPHDVSFGTIKGDIKVQGTLRKPKVSALSGKTVAQAGLSALLSTITGGLAALPFVQTGGGPDANCGELVAESKSAGQKIDPSLKQKAAVKKG